MQVAFKYEIDSTLKFFYDVFDVLLVPQKSYAVSTFRGTLDQYEEFHRSIPGVITDQGYEPLDMWQNYNYELYPEEEYDWSNDDAFQEIQLHWSIK